MNSGNIIIYKPNKLGYTFTGWTTPEDNRLRENFVINDGTYGNINLIANYVPNNYTISFDVNGGKELLNNKVIVEFDANYILSIPARESYEFLGWTNENGEIFLNEYKINIVSMVLGYTPNDKTKKTIAVIWFISLFFSDNIKAPETNARAIKLPNMLMGK